MRTSRAAICTALLCFSSLGASPIAASVLGISATTTTPALFRPDTVDAEIVDFTAGGLTYDKLVFFQATSVNNTSQPFAASSSPTPPSTVAAVLEMVSSPFITQGKANAQTVDYLITGRALDASEDRTFFMYELNLNGQVGDDLVVYPMAGGTPIPGWSLAINTSDYGSQSPLFDISWLSNVGVRGVAFSLADFTGGGGALTGVDGLRFYDAQGGWDPISVGMSVPEPSMFALAAIGGLLLAIRRRRR